jgi:NAD(P)-dependent dehydrogenase (short-subunit alcohol dehydrogenase family)
MKVLVIGASGTIGAAVAQAFEQRHEVVRVSRSTSPLSVDISDAASIKRLFAKSGRLDAIVNVASSATFRPVLELSDEDIAGSVNGKLLGQVNLVRYGADALNDGGSFTLTSGILSRRPTAGGSVFGLVNAGIEGFVRAAALDLPRGLRVNAVSPGWVAETLQGMGRDPKAGTPAAVVAEFYVRAVEGGATGQTLDVVPV